MKINVYRINDGVITARRETWDTVSQCAEHYGDAMSQKHIQLKGWADNSARLVKGTDTNGVALGVNTTTTI